MSFKYHTIGTFPKWKRSKTHALNITRSAAALIASTKRYEYVVDVDYILYDYSIGWYWGDCSSFVETVLHESVPAHYSILNRVMYPELRKRNYPIYARMFAEYSYDLEHGRHTSDSWEPVVDVAEVRPGDIYAIKYIPSERSTGHVMILTSQPKPTSKEVTFTVHNGRQTKKYRGGNSIYKAHIAHSYGGGMVDGQILFIVDDNRRVLGHIRRDKGVLESFPLMKFLRAKN